MLVCVCVCVCVGGGGGGAQGQSISQTEQVAAWQGISQQRCQVSHFLKTIQCNDTVHHVYNTHGSRTTSFQIPG